MAVATVSTAKLSDAQMAAIYNAAHEAGKIAAAKAVPTPMVVVNEKNPAERYFVADGACGFAWVTVRPGNSRFAKWLKANGYAHPNSYSGGMQIWISAYNQSITLKEAYAFAFAESLRNAGITAFAGSRLD